MLTPFEMRLFLWADEWCWLALCAFLLSKWTEAMCWHKADDPMPRRQAAWKKAFHVVFVVGALMIYGIGYPSYWGWIHL